MTYYQTEINLPDFYCPARPLSTSSYQAAKKRPSLLSFRFRRSTHGPPTLPSLTAWCILLTKLESSFSIWQDLRVWLAWWNLQEKGCTGVFLSFCLEIKLCAMRAFDEELITGVAKVCQVSGINCLYFETISSKVTRYPRVELSFLSHFPSSLTDYYIFLSTLEETFQTWFKR